MRAFYANKYIFCAKNVSIGTQLRYFNSTVSQIACFAGSSTTLSVQDCHKLDIAFRVISDEKLLVTLMDGIIRDHIMNYFTPSMNASIIFAIKTMS